MGKMKYDLNNGEKIVYKTSCVRHGFWGAYTNNLIITNQSVILEKHGLFDNYKGIERYNYQDIKQAILGEAQNGEKQLEIYIENKVEDFALQSGDQDELDIIIMAINDQMKSNNENYDYNYYNNLVKSVKDAERLTELKIMSKSEDVETDNSVSGLNIAKNTVKNVVKSGDFSLHGIEKGAKKAYRKEKRKKTFGGIMDKILDDVGVRDIQDSFTEMGNDLREGFGLKHKMTYAEKKELKELEEKQQKNEIIQAKKDALHEKVKEKSKSLENNTDIEHQFKLLKQAKELLDAGILTQEEFEQKKQEIMNK